MLLGSKLYGSRRGYGYTLFGGFETDFLFNIHMYFDKDIAMAITTKIYFQFRNIGLKSGRSFWLATTPVLQYQVLDVVAVHTQIIGWEANPK